ncbi:MAG: ABC transporter permease subunit [Synergistaceae bacterium]|jgi:ABC-2 type transport system permease protein|nr:ABC transporter permease subunit [Synergistaceae bacterium]
MRRGRRLWALVRKEKLQIVRDPSSIVIAFALPLLLLFLFGYGITLDAKSVQLGLALEDEGWEARDLSMAFQGSPYFEPQVSPARQKLFPLVAADELKGVLVIPHGFSAAFRAPGRAAQLQLAVDGTFPNAGSMAQSYGLEVISQWVRTLEVNADRVNAPSIRVEPRYWYNSEMESRRAVLPGILAIIMALIGTMLTSLVVAREWERGTMEALLSTPAGAFELLLGKFIPYYLLAVLSTFFNLGVVTGLFGIPFRGSLFALFCVTSLFMLSALGQGLIISTLARNQYIASFAALMSAFLPAALLSGFVFEIGAMPPLQRAVAAVLPARYLVTCLSTLFLAGDVWGVLLPNMLKLTVLGVFFMGMALRGTRGRLD